MNPLAEEASPTEGDNSGLDMMISLNRFPRLGREAFERGSSCRELTRGNFQSGLCISLGGFRDIYQWHSLFHISANGGDFHSYRCLQSHDRFEGIAVRMNLSSPYLASNLVHKQLIGQLVYRIRRGKISPWKGSFSWTLLAEQQCGWRVWFSKKFRES